MSVEIQSAIIALAGVIIGVVIPQLVQLSVTRRDRVHEFMLKKIDHAEARRTKRYELLINRLEELTGATQEFESFLGKPVFFRESDEGQYELASIIGKARTACLAVRDEELIRISRDVLTPYRVKQGQDSSNEDYESRNRNGLEKAIIRLTDIIKDIENADLTYT